MNALIGLEDKSQLVLSSSGIGLPQPGQQPRDPGPALLRGHPLRGNLFDAVLPLPAMESEAKAGSPR